VNATTRAQVHHGVPRASQLASASRIGALSQPVVSAIDLDHEASARRVEIDDVAQVNGQSARGGGTASHLTLGRPSLTP
jgi:hypothetical protein